MRIETPTIIVIFGATGDLAKSRLYGALFSLFQKKMLPSRFKIVGFARGAVSPSEFQSFILKSIRRKSAPLFIRSAAYVTGLFEELDAYKRSGKILLGFDREWKACSNKLFYLAVSPKYYKTIFENLARSGLSIPCSDGDGWTRVLVEKPFGHDLGTSEDLEEVLTKLFKEEQIFRIDHYLARETMQNILAFRFSNAIFEPLWNNTYIDRIEVKLLEKKGIGQRGILYDELGALRDVGQNHILQMLGLVAMDNPKVFETAAIRHERAKILEALRPMSEGDVKEHTVRGQYKGFRSVRGVRRDSQTETYFRIHAFVDNERWKGVPFYLESGKGLLENRVEINIYFKEIMPCFCPPPHTAHHHKNLLSFTVKPQEGIAIRFFAKKPGLHNDIEVRNLSFAYRVAAKPHETRAQAYQKVLFDCIAGEQMLFASSEEVRAAWRFITPILQGWEKNKSPLIIYNRGKEIV
ncbi:MAG: glucose-6-phosphate dehydrogenase [Candidatus Spechtbacteria bacterium]|nr:glucose-6-phosphate dehydrogenase [Candidatus Spechtbacteria bacterium]